MSESELRDQLAAIRKRGFDDAFIGFCAKEFSSHTYPKEELSAARMYGVYLRLALEGLTGENYKELLAGEEGESALVGVYLEITRESWQESLSSDRPFCELFVEKWCRRFADGESGTED